MRQTNLYSQDAEMATLGAMLLSSTSANACVRILRDEHFYNRSHQFIFDAMVTLAMRGVPIDLATVKVQLDANNKLKEAGGEDYLIQIAEWVPSPKVGPFYAEQVLQHWSWRTLDARLDDLKKLVSEKTPVTELFGPLRDAMQGLGGIGNDTFKADSEEWDADKSTHGVPSWCEDINRGTTCSGWPAGQLSIVMAYRGTGKTAWALEEVDNYLKDSLHHIGYASYEMSHSDLKTRLLTMRTGWSMSQGQLELEQMNNVQANVELIKSAKWTVYDPSRKPRSEHTVEALIAWVLSRHSIEPFDEIIIDYLQLLIAKKKCESRREEVEYISGELRWLARAINVPVIALSQVSIGSDGEPKAKESGRIEEDAALVVCVYRAEGELRGQLRKNRFGLTGGIWPLNWDKKHARFKA